MEDEEIASLMGINPETLHPDSIDPDNPAVDAIIKGGGTYQDARGRPIISFRQFKEMSALGHRMENYLLRMRGPFGAIQLAQATKYHKWYGDGYRAIDEPVAPRAAPVGTVTVFKCNDKYPDCIRFFDSQRGRETHWGAFHEKKFEGKKNAQPL